MGGWVGSGYGCVGGVPCAHTHIHMHPCMHMHVKHDKRGCLHVCGHLQFLYMYTCVCVHVCACGDTPMPPDTPTPEPQGAQNTKIQ